MGGLGILPMTPEEDAPKLLFLLMSLTLPKGLDVGELSALIERIELPKGGLAMHALVDSNRLETTNVPRNRFDMKDSPGAKCARSTLVRIST
jgi:hypothetical protein